jgi:hypothetical protein
MFEFMKIFMLDFAGDESALAAFVLAPGFGQQAFGGEHGWLLLFLLFLAAFVELGQEDDVAVGG